MRLRIPHGWNPCLVLCEQNEGATAGYGTGVLDGPVGLAKTTTTTLLLELA